MEGGTTFHFVTEGPGAALALAKEAARGKDVRISGGVSTIHHFLESKAEGEHLFSGLNLSSLGFGPPKIVPGENGTHILLNRQTSDSA